MICNDVLSKDVVAQQFSLAQEVKGGVARLCLFGELDLATVPLLEAGLDRAGGAAQPTIVLDLGELTFIDSAGLHAVLSAKEERQLTLVDGSRPVRRIFELTGNDHLLEGSSREHR